MSWIVYSKDGVTPKFKVKRLEYSGEFLGACSLTVTLESPTPIRFAIGDYLVYRGERFEINYDPSVIKSSSIGTSGDGFSYENVVFNSLSDELTRCDFLDYVPGDNQIHYSSLPNFSFFADTIGKLAERIQVNLDRVYQGEKKWTVEVHPEYVSKTNVNITVSSLTCWDALALVKSQFDANFVIRNRTITIGTTGLPIENVFSYGKGNGFITIEKNAESEQKIITRLRAYGSTRNMPTRYYANLSDNLPNNLAVNNLMLPSFPDETLDPYIDSENIEELGVRESTIFFDGSGELEEIYPSMEGMTAEELKDAGISVSATGRLDEIVEAERIADDGVFEDDAEIPPFTITLKDVGFDINEHLATETATISLKDGMCGGRDFEIVSCVKEGSNYVLTCNRVYDEGLDLYFPYNEYPIKAGDKFVLLNIEMPDAYVKAASQRLYQAAKNYLAKNDYVRYSYTPQVDSLFMARQHDEAVKLGLKSIHDTIKEGGLMLFEDADLGVEGSVIIDSLRITEYEDDSLIPSYEVTLRNDKAVGTIEKIQNQIDSIVSGQTGISGSGGGYTSSQIKSLILAHGSKYFLRKDKDDRTAYSLGIGGKLTVEQGATIKGDTELDDVVVNESIHSKEFVSGFTGGKGWAIRKKEYTNAAGVTEERYVIEADDIVARGSIKVMEFIASQMLGENDNRTFTAMLEVDHYDVESGKVWLKTQDGKLYNPFREGDYVMVMQYNGEPSEENGYYITKQYELIVTEVGVGDMSLGEDRLDWVKFRSFASIMEGADTSLITEGDTFVRIDNISDPNRKGIIQMMSVGESTPYIDIIYGAKTDPDNSLKGRFGNLQGIYSPLFGWLREFGTYLINAYIVGEFRIAHTGEDVADAIEIAKGSFRTNYRQTTYDMTEEQNFFTNAAFTNDAEHWVLSEEETGYFLVDGLPQYFNHDLYASENTFAGVASFNERDMLRLCGGNVKQLNALIKKPSTHMEYSGESTQTEVVDTTYLNIRVYCVADSTLECGFVNSSGTFYNNVFHVTRELEANIDAYTISVSGKWDGKGDFVIKSSGDVYIDLLSLTDKPLENFKVEASTRIEQNAYKISLIADRITATEGSLAALEITAGKIQAQVVSIEDDLGVTKDELDKFKEDSAEEFDSLSTDIATALGWQSNMEKAGLSATMIQQSKDTINIVAGAFTKDANGDYKLTTAAGTLVKADINSAMAAIYATKDGVTASLATKVSFDPTTHKITSNVIITGDRITLNGATTVNNYFTVNTDGTITCTGGTIGGFKITESYLQVGSNVISEPDKNTGMFMLLNAAGVTVNMLGRITANTAIGLQNSTIADNEYFVSMAMSHLSSLDATAKFCGLKLELQPDDIGVYINGGSTHILSSGITKLYGLVLNKRAVTSSLTLSENDDIVVFSPSANITISLPTEAPVGKVYYLKNISSYTVSLTGSIRGANDASYSNGSTRALSTISWMLIKTDVAWTLFNCGQ